MAARGSLGDVQAEHEAIGRRFLLAMILSVLVAVAGTASAAGRVAIVHDENPNPLQQRTVTRLRAELAAAGFEVSEITRAGDAREAAEADPPLPGAFATIAIVARSSDAADI